MLLQMTTIKHRRALIARMRRYAAGASGWRVFNIYQEAQCIVLIGELVGDSPRTQTQFVGPFYCTEAYGVVHIDI